MYKYAIRILNCILLYVYQGRRAYYWHTCTSNSEFGSSGGNIMPLGIMEPTTAFYFGGWLHVASPLKANLVEFVYLVRTYLSLIHI